MRGSVARLQRTFAEILDSEVRKDDGTKKNVAVIGAGLAGLSAAWFLKRADHTVTVFEASERAGGRVLTIPFEGGQYAEAGALYIPENHRMTTGFAGLFNLELRQFPTLTAIVHMRKKTMKRPNHPDQVWPKGLLTDQERSEGLRKLMWRLVYTLPLGPLEQLRDTDWLGEEGADALAYDTMTFAEYLQGSGASPGAIELVRLGMSDLWGDGIAHTSALLLLRDYFLFGKKIPSRLFYELPGATGPGARRDSGAIARDAERVMNEEFGNPPKLSVIAGGNDRLPTAFANALGRCIRYECPVTRIAVEGQDQLRVEFRSNGDTKAEVFDRVICAIPFSVLRDIKRDHLPSMTDGKWNTIDGLRYTSVTKVFVQTTKQFWLPTELSPFAVTDRDEKLIDHQTAGLDGDLAIMSAFSTGKWARDLRDLGKEGRENHFVETLSQIYQVKVKPLVRKTDSFCWDGNPYAKGGYCWFAPGEMARFSKHVDDPVGRLHFAGDHTSPLPGWMEGALESGVRAAHEVNIAPL